MDILFAILQVATLALILALLYRPLGDWIARDNPQAARAMTERLYRRCQSLDLFPERGRPYGNRYRAVDERPNVIIYRIDQTPAHGHVIIVAVLVQLVLAIAIVATAVGAIVEVLG